MTCPEPKEPAWRHEPSRPHISVLSSYKDQDFYRGLCSESRIIRANGKVEWIPDKSVRNEPLDLAVMCRAAAAICGIDSFSDEDWSVLEGSGTDDTAPHRRDYDSHFGERQDWMPKGRNWF